MKRAYTNGILLDGTEQMEPVRGKVLLTENDKITAIADARSSTCTVGICARGSSTCTSIWQATANPAQSPGTMQRWYARS